MKVRIKTALFIMFAICFICLIGCNGKKSNSYQSGSSTQTSWPVQTATPTPTPKPASTPTPKPAPTPTPRQVNVKLSEYKFTTKDSDGYSYEITVKYSPWMLLSKDYDAIKSVWNKVGKNNQLPGFNDWGFSKGSYREYRKHYDDQGANILDDQFDASDLWYLMGEISVRNTTDGWSITTDKPRVCEPIVFWECFKNRVGFKRVYYSNSHSDYCSYLVRAQLVSNTWGPVPFIAVIPENFTPNYPNGESREKIEQGKFVSWWNCEAEFYASIYGEG